MLIVKTALDYGKRATAALLIGLVLFLSLAGANPSLHQAIHPDANAPDHHCVVKLFTQGQVDAADSAPVVVLPAPAYVPLELAAGNSVFPSADYSISSSRAPPCAGVLHS